MDYLDGDDVFIINPVNFQRLDDVTVTLMGMDFMLMLS